MIHSPFHVVEDFVSPLFCETVLKNLALSHATRNPQGQMKYERVLPDQFAGTILSELDAISPLLADRFGAECDGEPSLMFQQYFEDHQRPAEGLHCGDSVFARKKWTKTKNIDLVGFIWLKTFHDSVPLDPRIEVYGGKLEFPSYNFSLTPAAGTLVLYPATPHFVTAISHVMVGSLDQIKIGIKLKDWVYDPSNFSGTYKDWFFA